MDKGKLKDIRNRAVPVMRAFTLAALVLSCASMSCGGLGECEPGSGSSCKLRGYEVVGGEVWAFQRCRSDVLLSVNVKGSEPGFEKLDGALHESMGCTEVATGTWSCLRQGAAVYIEMTATISALGHYGHLGKYEREIDMLQIHEASAVGPSDCTKLDPIFP